MSFCVCVAADCEGEKVNLRFFFHAKPSDREVIARATAAFTNYFTSHYVGHPFVVRMAVVFSEPRGIWEHLKHPAQLHHNCQVYVFQPSTCDAPGEIQDPIDALPYLEGYMPPTGFATDLPFPPALRSPKPHRPTSRYYSPTLRDYCDSQEIKDESWNTHATSSSREGNPAVRSERYVYPLAQEKRSTPVKNLNGDFVRVSHASPLREDGRSNSLEISLSWPRNPISSKEVTPTKAGIYSQRHLQAPLLSSGSLKSNVTSPSESLVVTITTFDPESQQLSRKVPGTRCGSSLYDGRRSGARLYSASGSREKSILREEREKIDQQLNMPLDTMRVVLHEETAQMKKSVSPPRD